LLTTERTPTLNIEWGQINPKAGGGCNIDSGQNDPKATQGLIHVFISLQHNACCCLRRVCVCVTFEAISLSSAARQTRRQQGAVTECRFHRSPSREQTGSPVAHAHNAAEAAAVQRSVR